MAMAILGLQDGANMPLCATQVGMLQKQHRDHSDWNQHRLYVVHHLFVLSSESQADNKLLLRLLNITCDTHPYCLP